MNLPASLEQLIAELSKLPGVGKKTAKRLAFSLLLRPEQEAFSLSKAIIRARSNIRSCPICFGLTDNDHCLVCSDQRRNKDVLCIVEDPRNIFSIENSGIYNGFYHVLEGAISPLRGITPEHLRIDELMLRIKEHPIQELILATNPTLEGEATAHYLTDLFKGLVNSITRIARGMPAGGDLEYTDSSTLARAFEGRIRFESN